MGKWFVGAKTKCPYCGKHKVLYSRTAKGKLIGRCGHCENWLYTTVEGQ